MLEVGEYMNKKTKWILILVAFIILVIISFGIRGNVHAQGDYPTISPIICEWDCPSISPSEDISPTAGDSATPSASPSAQPIYPTPTEGSGGYFDDGLGCGTHSCIGKPGYIPVPTASTPQGAPMTGRAE